MAEAELARPGAKSPELAAILGTSPSTILTVRALPAYRTHLRALIANRYGHVALRALAADPPG